MTHTQPRPLVTAAGLRRAGETARRRLVGIVYLVILALLLALTVAIYQKKFVSIVPVTLEADHIGNQLTAGADVKLRGVLVGEVRKVSSEGRGARLSLALKPGMAKQIPSNVEAQLLPKTLFGERYVALVVPRDAAGPIHSGAVIPEDRSTSAIQVQKVLDDLMPVLRTLKPDQLNATLSAVAGALDGRGEELGDNLTKLGDYVGALNTKLPVLQHDISALADVADTYNAAAPDLLGTLDNLSTTSDTVVAEKTQLDTLFRSTSGVSSTATAVLAENEQNLIHLTKNSQPLLNLLAKYSPEFPCLLQGLADFEPRVEDAFSSAGPGLHLTLEVIKDRGKFTPGEYPQYVAHPGPKCYGLPGHPSGNFPNTYIPDGSKPSGQTSLPLVGSAPAALQKTGGDIGEQGSPQEVDAVKGLIAAQDGTTPSKVSTLDAVLYSPLVRGAEVTLK
jgi:virulence factor Mce-like protein